MTHMYDKLWWIMDAWFWLRIIFHLFGIFVVEVCCHPCLTLHLGCWMSFLYNSSYFLSNFFKPFLFPFSFCLPGPFTFSFLPIPLSLFCSLPFSFPIQSDFSTSPTPFKFYLQNLTGFFFPIFWYWKFG